MEAYRLRYIIFKDGPNLKKDINYRKLYIYDTFSSVYRIEEKEYEDRIELECFSICKMDIIIIIGHYYSVDRYISKNASSLECETLIIISCFVNRMDLNKLKKVKKIYVSKSKNGETERYIGRDYGFNFKITDSELMLYNTKKMELQERIKKSFDYMEKRKKRNKVWETLKKNIKNML